MEAAIFSLIGVALGGVLTLAREWWFQSRKDQKDAQYLCAVVSCALQSFSDRCADVVGDDGLSDGQPDERGYHQIQVEAPRFTIDGWGVEWKSLPSALMYKVLDFPNQAAEAASSASVAFEYATPPDFSEGFEERQFLFASLGLVASSLAAELREHTCLPALQRPHRQWDPITYMSESKAKIEQRRAERARTGRSMELDH